MKKFIAKKTILFASIVLIAGVIAAQAFAHMGGNYQRRGGYNMMNNNHMGYGNQMGYGNHMGENGIMGNGYMMESLSAEDQKKMQDQMDEFYSSTKGLRGQYYQKRTGLNQEYSKSEKDQAKIDTLEKELFDLSAQIEKKRFENMNGMQKFYSNKGSGSYMGRVGYGGCF